MMVTRRPFPTRSPRSNKTEQLSGQDFASFSKLTAQEFRAEPAELSRKKIVISRAIFYRFSRTLFLARISSDHF